MNKLTVSLLAVLTLNMAFSAGWEAVKPARKTTLTPEQLEQRIAERQRYNGGILEVPGKGNLAIVNSQNVISLDQIKECVKDFKSVARDVNVSVVSDAFSLERASAVSAKHGAASLYVIDDPNLSLSLIALEEGWAMMNVAKLRSGDPDAKKLAARFRKEFVRISSIIFSGAKSQYLGSPLQTVRSIADLDKTVGDNYGIDYAVAFMSHLKDIGVTPTEVISYRSGCERGIAPPPTNDIQKAVWDQVHEIPGRPLKVEFNKAK